MDRDSDYYFWIPFLGFREEFIDEFGMPCIEETPYKAQVFQFSWLGFSYMMFVGEVEDA